jgi:transcriptional regulator with XRE-family HTH domain
VISERLKSLRKERDLTQRVVARGVDIAERQYQTYEHGERKPSYEILVALADYFNVSLDYLVGRTDKKEL